MQIPKFWAKHVQSVQHPDGRRFRLVSWQWSDRNADEAQQRAVARVNALAQKVLAGAELDRYGYGERPLREEIVQTLADVAVLTRNSYGAVVLNTANTMFIDIDFAEKDSSTSSGPLQRMFGRAPANPEARYLAQVQQWASRFPQLGLRIYRTYAGLRALVTNQVFDPRATEAADVLRAFNSDPLYIRLCQAQSCFRARLTPKPWRCELGTPPTTYPWDNADDEARFRQWQQQYERVSANFSVCRLLQQIGPTDIHPQVERILYAHDQSSGVSSSRALA